jgi:hypothetical protein
MKVAAAGLMVAALVFTRVSSRGSIGIVAAASVMLVGSAQAALVVVVGAGGAVLAVRIARRRRFSTEGC